MSALPDELVVSIVSCLPLKEAVATSILSRRWKHVWKSTRTLNLFDTKFDLTRCHFLFLKREAKDEESREYVDWVNGVLQQHSSSTIERFRASFDIDRRFISSVDKWIKFAMNKRVQILELEFQLEYGPKEDIYAFPHKLLGLEEEPALELNHLYSSDTPRLHSCGNNIGFKFLKVIHFQCVDVTRQVLDYFLSHCPTLERLTVSCVRSLTDVRVVGPSIALKHLALMNCNGLKRIEVQDVDLVSFCYYGLEVEKVLLRNLPLLTEVSYTYVDWRKPIEIPFARLSCCLSQLEILKLDITQVDYNLNLVFPLLANLKQLELKVAEADYTNEGALLNVICFMKASPHLQILELKLVEFLRCPTRLKIRNTTKFSHRCLKVVNVVGYRGRIGAARHVMCLVKHAVALEKIVIDPVRHWISYPRETDRRIEEVEEEVQARVHAMEYLKVKVPSTIEFVCL